ncbi:hypothetical protein NGRA_1294 [Nosema granulosis]|uniref:Pol polyprotein n=1 Tax=Nosema granulosis TaxID=83296 RepID=A0A9P6H1F7_9MICR|nr:hypothetical protein NGRA_1294 [Nosema granulosis]
MGYLTSNFLKKHNCTICFTKGTKVFKEVEDNLVDPDETILNKIYSPYSTDNNTVKSIVENYKRKNPTLGLIKGCKIHLYPNDHTLLRHKPYPIALIYTPKVKYDIRKALNLNIIRKSESSYAYSFPAFSKPRKNGDIRLLIDYRSLNKKPSNKDTDFRRYRILLQN